MLTTTRRQKTTRTVPGPFGPKTITETTEERVELLPPKRWGMFTSLGNLRLTTLAKRAMAEIEAAKDKAAVKKVLIHFLVCWERLGENKKFGEAGDTAVREVVGDFHDKLAVASGHWGEWDVTDLWEKHRDAAYGEARRLREAKKAREAAKPRG